MKTIKINYFMHALPGRIYNLAVPPSDTPVCVAGEAEPVLVGTAVYAGGAGKGPSSIPSGQS